MNKIFGFIFLIFIGTSCLGSTPDTAKADTLFINSDLILVKKNNHIINKDGKEKFYQIWMGQEWSEKKNVADIIHKDSHFFDGFSSQEMSELFGQPDEYGRYLYMVKRIKGQKEYCWIQFIFKEDQVSLALFPCS